MGTKNSAGDHLTSEESEQLERIIMDRIHIIRYTIVKIFGVMYLYLVDDCVSEVVLLACQKGRILLNHSNPGGWLVNASKNIAHNMIRKHKKEIRNVSIDELESVSVSEDVFEEMLYQEWLKKRIPELLVSRLTKREQEIYDLLFVQKKTPQAIAEELHISVNTVRNIKKSIVDKIKNDIYAHNF